MKIDFTTGKVYYPDRDEELKESLEEMKIKENLSIKTSTEEAVFQKTRHQGLKHGRWKFMFYCFLLMVDGLIGLVSIGQTQSIIAQKYLMSDHVIGDYNDRQNSS